jgi:hypothetical protein
MAGTPENKLVIKSISMSRKELLLVPTFKLDPTNEENVLLNLETSAFAQKKMLVRDIIDQLFNELDKYQIYSRVDSLVKQNETTFNLMRTLFGFKNNLDVIKFLNDTYVGFKIPITGNDNAIVYETFDGISQYIKNWAYTYYKNIESTETLQSEFNYIVSKATEIRLNKYNAYFENNTESKKIITDFITNVFYNDFILNVVQKIGNSYKEKYLSYLQNALNFGNNVYIPILNYTGYNDSGIYTIIVKLVDYLPNTINIRDKCWISNISTKPLIQKVVLNTIAVKKGFKIAGPNFNIKTDGYKTKAIDFNSSDDLKLTDSDKKNVDFYKKLTELNVDYSEFSNFIIFSSAELRTKLFLNKLIKINQLTETITQYESASFGNNLALSMSYDVDVKSTKAQINSIYTTFDGYESYLINTPMIQGGLSNNNELISYISSSIDYDKYNSDSLVNNTPNHVVVNEDNSDYLIFLSMIGHHFDNIYLYINKSPILSMNSDNVDDVVFSNGVNSSMSAFANILLEQFGWTPISSFDSSDINSTFTPNTNSISEHEKLKLIWNRILKNLPILYKTKGTEECIRLMSNIYGIPHNLLNVKEFGGNNISTEDNSSYIFEQKYYFTKFKGNDFEQLILPSTTPVRAIEFKFRVDQTIDYADNTSINLMSDYSLFWSVSINKTRGKYRGSIKFEFSGLPNQALEITNIPIFNGKIYNVLIKLADTTETFDTTDGTYPEIVLFRVTCVEDDRIVFDETKTQLIPYENVQFFETGSTIYIGNYTENNRFIGNIDKVNIWKTALSDEAYLDHCKNFNAYNNYSPSTTYADLFFKYGYDYPINLFTGSSFIAIQNANKYYYTETGSASGFYQTDLVGDCNPVSGSLFPYQFDEIDIRQNIRLDNAGPNKYKNSKITRATETAVSRLMPFERSVVSNNITNDSNLIGVYISPFKIRDDDMLEFIGNYDIMNEIGDPSQLYNNNYDILRQLRDSYNKNNLAEKVLYQEFLTLYKNYFDGSFFETVKRLLPARAKIIDGIIIEQSILERSKYQNRPIESAISKDLTATVLTPAKYSISSTSINMFSAEVDSKIAKNGAETIGYRNNITDNYISDSEVEVRNSVYSINGNCALRDSTGSYVNKTPYKLEIPHLLIGDNSNLRVNIIKYTFVNSGDVVPDKFVLDTQSYPPGHYSLAYNPFKQNSVVVYNSINSSTFIKSQQTIYTTVNEQGIPDGSLPIEITRIDRNINQISLTSN